MLGAGDEAIPRRKYPLLQRVVRQRVGIGREALEAPACVEADPLAAACCSAIVTALDSMRLNGLC